MGICGSEYNNEKEKQKLEQKKPKSNPKEKILNNQKEEIERMKEKFEDEIEELEKEIKEKMETIKKLENENKDKNKKKIESLKNEIKNKLVQRNNKMGIMKKFSEFCTQLENQKDINIINDIMRKIKELLNQTKVNNDEFIKNKDDIEEIGEDQKELFDNLHNSNHFDDDIEKEMKALEEDYKMDNLPNANKGDISIKREIEKEDNKREIVVN